jgi:hypothetical protein
MLLPTKKELIYLKRGTIDNKNMLRAAGVGAINKAEKSLP